MRPATATAAPVAITLAAEKAAPQWIMLLPAGEIRALDGRVWQLRDAPAVAATSNEGGVALPIDWEHAQDHKAPAGEPAPAAGWIEALEARAGALWGRVVWTDKGRASIEAREYRYISPSFMHRQDGEIVRLIGAGLVNRPAIAMPALAREQETSSMDKELIAALGLGDTATSADALAAVTKLKGDLATAQARATTPDLARYVPRADYDQALARATAAEARIEEAAAAAREAEIAALVDQAVTDGKIAPASKDFYLSTARAEGGIETLKTFLATAPVIVATHRLDNAEEEPDTSDPVALARAARVYQTKLAGEGIAISHADAVLAIREGRA